MFDTFFSQLNASNVLWCNYENVLEDGDDIFLSFLYLILFVKIFDVKTFLSKISLRNAI
jgi:hypothetical protein